jgi:hypothetical protein
MARNIKYEQDLENRIHPYEAKSDSIDVRGMSESDTFEFVPYQA